MTRALAAGAVLAILTVHAIAARDTTVPFPAGYREFTHVKSTLVGPQSPAFASNAGYHHFYANAPALEGYRTGTFPDGSILIDDGLEAVAVDGVMTEGRRRRIAVMVKDSRRYGGTRGWGFETFPGDTGKPSLSADGQAACLSCHQRAKRDLVFSEFRK